MEPILQRFGDVTIQRLEKPKVPVNNDPSPSKTKEVPKEDEHSLSSNADSELNDETASLKRSFPDSQISIKRFKVDKNNVLPEKNTTQTLSKQISDEASKISDVFLNNFSEGEFSDFDSESEMESEAEFPETSSKSGDESLSTSFLENYEEEPQKEEPNTPSEPPKSESVESPEDYDFDIKEKLKEMGEISFQTVKKGEVKPKKVEVSTENEVVVTPAKKLGSSEEEAGLKGLPLRRNIREVMDETKLDESTLAAQRQEMERLQRVQEQQRLLRELQRQNAQERMQHKVLSLLQGNNHLSKPGTSSTRIGNTVLVKLPNGQTKPMTKLPKKPVEMLKVQKNSGPMPPLINQQLRKSPVAMRRPEANLTPSVSIAPVAKKPFIRSKPESESDSEDELRLPPQIKADPTPVVPTIDISSDEDCIVVSEPEESDEPDDDPSNSGMHTNDEFNQPDDQGRVVVNIAHPDNEPDIFLAPQLSRVIKPHQIGGVRFLYDNVIESTTRFESSTGFGCILAHSMGLGKTLQIVCFSDIFLRNTPARTILCIMPINTLQNWLAEYNMWLPSEENAANSPLINHGEVRPRNFNLHVLNDSHKTLTARHKVIHQWRTGGGVLLIGYEQFRLLSLRKNPKSRRKVQPINEVQEEDKNKMMFDEVHEALVKPGPDLVICDEGHRIKNSHASISQALKQMRTKRRVVLTGYPLQNNLMEYWCMVDFVRPNYLGTKSEFCNMFERPIMNGQCIDSTETDIKLMRYRAHVLHSLLVGFVQRRSHAVLQTALPQKEEYVLLVRMSPFQRKLYEVFMDEVVRSQSVPNPLKAFAVCCKIWNHPDVLYNFLKKRARGDAVDIDLEEVASTTVGAEKTKTKKSPARPRKNAGRGKNGAKPAASVTPYTTNSETTPTVSSLDSNSLIPAIESPQSSTNVSQNANPNDNTIVATNPFQQNYFQSSNSNFGNFGMESTATRQPNNFLNENNQFGNNFQNFWNQSTFNQSNDWQHQFNPNLNVTNSNQSWLKCDENSRFSVKSENSNDSKPKINIISDIKLPPVFSPATSDKKIKILSDIKLEPKLEDIDNKPEIKPDIKKMIKEEIKNEVLQRSEEEIPPLNELIARTPAKEDTGIPYDWAIELLKDYVPGCIENSGKMEILFCIIRESIALGDRLLVFSQSLITLDLIEQFLQMNFVPGDTVKWARNCSYYRLDGSTSALEREKLINEFNSNPKIHVFLVSTRAGSLGINLIGANRVVVLDASWNPCHDTQAVCRVYRYGQRKPCFVYRLVVDNCLEKKIYDRQINKQGMSDRVVDECNPDAHLTMKDVSTLCWDDQRDEGEEKDWSDLKDNYIDVVLQKVIVNHGRRLNKQPFQHESLLVDRKEKQLSQQEKRLAKKSYEREKQAARQPAYNLLTGGRGHRPVASVRPMQQGLDRPSRWIPAEHWQRQGMTAQEMTLPLDVVIPTNQPEKGNIVLKAGQKVLVLKSPKGVYMQLESGKIVAIKTAIKVKGKAEDSHDPNKMMKTLPPLGKNNQMPTPPQKKIVKPFPLARGVGNIRGVRPPAPNLMQRYSKPPMQNDFNRGIPKESEQFPGSSSDEEHVERPTLDLNMPDSMHVPDDIQKRISILKKQVSIKRLPSATSSSVQEAKSASVLQRLEETATSVVTENAPFQETLDSITSSYKDDILEDDAEASVTSSGEPKPSHLSSDISDHSDDVTYVAENQSQQPYQNVHQQEIKSENPDYYNQNYYNYNNMQPYQQVPQPQPPPQAYVYQAQQPGFDMMGGYVAPQQPQYNYGYQGYGPQPPPPIQTHYAIPPQGGGYDYHAPPPPPPQVYPPYHTPYPQQYVAPPPPQTMYPPQPTIQPNVQNYQEYQQYNPQQSNATPYYPNT